jgi:hypothetical protein
MAQQPRVTNVRACGDHRSAAIVRRTRTCQCQWQCWADASSHAQAMGTGLQQGSWGRGARNLVLKPITRDGEPAGARGGLRARHRRAPHGPPGPAPGLGAQTGPRLDACIEHWCSPSRKTQLMQGREGPAIDSRLPLRRRRRRHRPRRRRHRGAAAPTCAAPFKLIRQASILP